MLDKIQQLISICIHRCSYTYLSIQDHSIWISSRLMIYSVIIRMGDSCQELKSHLVCCIHYKRNNDDLWCFIMFPCRCVLAYDLTINYTCMTVLNLNIIRQHAASEHSQLTIAQSLSSRPLTLSIYYFALISPNSDQGRTIPMNSLLSMS